MTRLLLPIEKASAARRIVRHVLDNGTPAEVHLVNVQPPVRARELWHFLESDHILENRLAQGEAELRPARELLESSGVACVSSVLIGEPAEVILRYARDSRCGAIVMGGSQRGRLGRLVPGSVSLEVASRAGIPVTLVGTPPARDERHAA
jgi:nucleotide-binding universal stress UspA family protein